MTTHVDGWLRDEGAILASASAEYHRIAQSFAAEMQSLQRIAGSMYFQQVSGPPGDYLHGLWQGWERQTLPIQTRLNTLSGSLHNTAQHWQQTYDSQKRQADAEKHKADKK